MKACYRWEERCECNLRNVGFAIGWLGAIYRALAIGRLAIHMAELPDDQQLYLRLFSILLAYGFVSLAADFLLVVGVNKRNHNYMVPYLGIYGVEISAATILLIGSIIHLIKMNETTILSYLIPSGLVFLSVYTLLWCLLLRFFRDLKSANEEDDTSAESLTSDFRSVVCSCGCLKSDSLDIAT